MIPKPVRPLLSTCLPRQCAARAGIAHRAARSELRTKNEWLDSARTEHQIVRIARRANQRTGSAQQLGDGLTPKSQRSVQEFRTAEGVGNRAGRGAHSGGCVPGRGRAA